MFRTAANRVGCVFWSQPTSGAWELPQGPRLQAQVPASSPTQAQPRATPQCSARPGWLAATWGGLQTWLLYWWPFSASIVQPASPETMTDDAQAPSDAQAASPTYSTQATPPPASSRLPAPCLPQTAPALPTCASQSARAQRAARLVSHPLELSSDSDTDTDDDLVENAITNAHDPLRECLIPGVDVAPQDLAVHPPRGLRVGFALTRRITAPMHAIARVICDSDRGCAWIDRCNESRLLKATSTGPIAYHRYQLPMVGDRDSVTRSTLEVVNADTLKITVQPWDSPDVAAPNGTVRIPWLEGSFTLVAETPDVTSVCHTSQLVLGGNIPGWLGPMIRKLQAKSPKQTLSRLAMLVQAGVPRD